MVRREGGDLRAVVPPFHRVRVSQFPFDLEEDGMKWFVAGLLLFIFVAVTPPIFERLFDNVTGVAEFFLSTAIVVGECFLIIGVVGFWPRKNQRKRE